MTKSYRNLTGLLCVIAMLLWACSDDVKGAGGSDGTGTDDGVSSDDSTGSDDNGESYDDSNNPPSTDSTAHCGTADVNFSNQIPTVLLLIDRSGSMDAGFPRNNDPMRWDVVKDALIREDLNNPENEGLVKQLQSDVRFGLSLYSSEGGGSVPDECPILINVAPAVDNFSAIEQTYNAAGLSVDTPTTESVQAAAATLATITEPGPRVIVLATDGDPDNCEDPDAHDTRTQEMAEDAVRAAYDNENITTFIISVGNGTTPAHMQRMANAGQGIDAGEPDAEWWLANDAAGLEDAFNTIVNGVRSCIMDLEGEIVSGKESSCEVYYQSGGQKISLTLDDPDGWRINTPSQVELLGAACTAIKSNAEVTANVACDCDGFTPDLE